MLDHEKQIHEYEQTILKLKEQNETNGIWTDEELVKMEAKLEALKTKVYSKLTAWERVTICRHPDRPKASHFIENICDDFKEIFGDRTYKDDRAIVAGLGTINGQKFAIIAQEKGSDTESRLYRNFGMPHPEGYRKALRVMKLAEKFNIPVLSILDTPGAYPGLSAEERGQGWAIANNLKEMAILKTPIVVLLIGEGCSGGALGMGVGDVIGMLEHAYYSVISPEGCASILWRDAGKNEVAAETLRMHCQDLLELGVVDEMIEEPLGGMQHNPEEVFIKVKDFVVKHADDLSKLPIEKLVENRYQKFRKLGDYKVLS